VILIADSGSTKTEWCFLSPDNTSRTLRTDGINPFYQTSAQIASVVVGALSGKVAPEAITDVFFYGAGCVAEKQSFVGNAIATVLPKANISVHSDLLGAARALLGQRAGIACILGTGSNSCYYDGEQIRQQVSPLGFILGDEGSGAVLGRKFIADCLKNQLPEKLRDKFLKVSHLSPAEILEGVYRQPFPNRFLAQFVPFMREHLAEPSIYNMVFDSFTEFFTRNVMQYPDFDKMPIGVVGSIGYYFRDVIEVAAEEVGITIGEIMLSPMEGLIACHRR
jgi:N-acetylglucosamine kinase-like BadF-type ATPase